MTMATMATMASGKDTPLPASCATLHWRLPISERQKNGGFFVLTDATIVTDATGKGCLCGVAMVRRGTDSTESTKSTATDTPLALAIVKGGG